MSEQRERLPIQYADDERECVEMLASMRRYAMVASAVAFLVTFAIVAIGLVTQ